MELSFSFNSAQVGNLLSQQAKQVNFAGVQTATALARLVQQEETAALPSVLDRPTPFTMKAFASTAARKSNPTAEVFAKQTQAKYLAPVEDGGPQVLGNSRAIRTPVDIRKNAYGNIPRNAIRSKLQGGLSSPGPKGYFIGVINGVNGLWQRVPGTKKNGGRRGLKLLVAFTKPVDLHPVLGFEVRGRRIVQENAARVFAEQLQHALATAK